MDEFLMGRSSAVVVVGVDGEMSSPDMSEGKVIRVGVASRHAGVLDVFDQVAAWPDVESGWSAQAESVHKLTVADVLSASPAEVVDMKAADWLAARGGKVGAHRLVAVGFNVGAFDLPFFRRDMPVLASMLARRSIDLNAVCFTLSGWDPVPGRVGRSAAEWKRAVKFQGAARVEAAGFAGSFHEAGYDAAVALEGWCWLREQLAASRSATAAPVV